MPRPKLWLRYPKTQTVVLENYDDFWRFVCERQLIWHRRFVLKQPPPWTTNKWLRDYKFTNVYRELDRGSIWLRNHVISYWNPSKPIAANQANLVWRIVLYRLLNRVGTFEKVGIPNFWEWPSEGGEWISSLRALHRKECIFTSAHLTLPTHKEGKSKLTTYREALQDLFEKLLTLYERICQADSLEQVFNILLDIHCVGPFISYEVCIDLMYANLIPFTENDWANAGPGCRKGIALLFPQSFWKKRFLEAMRDLQREQQQQFLRLGLDFPYYQGKLLSLRNIEHSLCEYSKYWSLQRGVGKVRQRFQPKSSHLLYTAQGQIPLFQKESL